MNSGYTNKSSPRYARMVLAAVWFSPSSHSIVLPRGFFSLLRSPFGLNRIRTPAAATPSNEPDAAAAAAARASDVVEPQSAVGVRDGGAAGNKR